MNRCVAATLLIAGLALSSCNLPAASADGDQANHHGRYAGVGLYGPSKQWTRLIANQQTKDPQAARPIDDQVIIVVQDTATGEVRACGDLTGYCIGMNPWKTALVSAQIAPIKLTDHVAPDPPDASAAASTRRPRHKRPGDKGGELAVRPGGMA